eukprot:s5590_g7.t1
MMQRSCHIALHAAAMIGCRAAVQQVLDARESVFEDVTLLQSSRAATFRGYTDAQEPANLSYAVRGMPMLNRCPNAHGGNDCGFKVSRPATE